MSNVSIEVEGLDKLVKKMGAGVIPIIAVLTRAVAEELKAELADYPGPTFLPFEFATDKSRRYYFAKRRRAGLGPYVRNSDPYSQRLGPSWATESRGRMNAAVGTRVTYAPWVQDVRRQIPGHRLTGWITDAEAIENVEDSGVIDELLDDIVRKW